MSQSFIDALMHFLALLFLPLPKRKSSSLKRILEEYVEKAGILVPAEDCLKVYNRYYEKYTTEFNLRNNFGDFNSTNYHEILTEAARRTQMNLSLRERFLLILALAEFTGIYKLESNNALSDIQNIAFNMNISQDDYDEAMRFLFQKEIEPDHTELRIEESSIDVLEGSWIESHKQEIDMADRHILSNIIKGKLFIKYFEKYHLFVMNYKGPQILFLNEKKVYPDYFYSFGPGTSIIFDGIHEVFFEEIASHFNLKFNLSRIKIGGKNIEYQYPNSGYMVKPFSFCEAAGQLIGIVGNNGVGKSTILKLIAGINEPSAGDVMINGASLKKNNFKLKSVIGFVAHNNMFFKELSVYENVYYHALLCMGDLSTEELHRKTLEVLKKFDLQDISEIKPSEFEEKRVSEFDRVSLNIAIELIRDPLILCLDEPFLGLPYADAKRLLGVLKEETFEGKIVFLSIHLPSPEIYNLFDKVWLIDSGGHVIFQGLPRSVRDHFNFSGIIPFHIISAREDLVSPEEIISLVETKRVRPDGVISDDRLVPPEVWYNYFRKKQILPKDIAVSDKPLPVKPSSIPGIEKQFLVYLLRLIKIRFSNLNFFLLTFAVIPGIGAILAVVTRYTGESGFYNLSQNIHFPVFLFLASSFIFFAGLLNGAGEIIAEKERNKRDLNLNLSWFSYINSKVFFIIFVSFFQSVLFTVFTSLILKVEGLMLPFITIYFSLLVMGGILSLVLSSVVRHISSVYITLPFIIIPNLLFSGFLIPYNNYSVNNERNTFHAMADITPARWAYEALMVESYANNRYNRNFYDLKARKYRADFYREDLLPLLFEKLTICRDFYFMDQNRDSMRNCLSILRKEVYLFSGMDDVAPFESYNKLKPDNFNEALHDELFGYLTYLNFYFESESNDLGMQIEFKEELAESDSEFQHEKQLHHNRALELMVLQGAEERTAYFDGEMRKIGASIYMIPDNLFGFSHFFAPVKRAGGQVLETLSFNITLLWTFSAIFYFVLLGNIFVPIFSLFRKRKRV
jgi:ABC transport system ATP-binding/permease protein